MGINIPDKSKRTSINNWLKKVNITNSVKNFFISFTMYYEILEQSMSTSSGYLLQLANLSSENFDDLKDNYGFIEMFKALILITKSIKSGKNEFSKREVLPRLSLLQIFCDNLVPQLTFSVSGSSKLRNDFHVINHCPDLKNAVRILLTEDQNITSSADFIITPQDVENVAIQC